MFIFKKLITYKSKLTLQNTSKICHYMFDLNIQCAVANYDGSPKIQKTNLYIFKTFIIILNDCI